MRHLMAGAAALALLAGTAAAQDNVRSDRTVQPDELTVAARRPPLTLDDRQAAAIRDALVAEHTQQKTPQGFAPQVGQTLPRIMKVDVMPLPLVRRLPSLKAYGYAKTARDILVLDPMTRGIIAVLPRKFPAAAAARPATPVDWAKTKGRELTGQPPEPAAAGAQPVEPAGDSGDVKNGNEQNARER